MRVKEGKKDDKIKYKIKISQDGGRDEQLNNNSFYYVIISFTRILCFRTIKNKGD